MSFSQPADELGVRLRRRALRAHGVAHLQRLAAAGHLAHAVAVGVLVAALVEQRLGLVEVELELLVVGDLRHPGRVRRRGDRVRGRRVPALDAVDDRLLVDRVRDRLAHQRVLERGVALLQAVAAVDRELLERALVALDDLDPLDVLEPVERGARHRVRGIDLTAAQRRDHRLRVVEVADHDRGERPLAAPVVRVRLEARELALLELGQVVGARADAVLPVVLGDLLRVVLLVDVLRDDVDVQHGQLRVRHRRLDLDRGRVDRLRLEVRGDRAVVEPLLLARAVDRVDDVVGGQRLAVGPLEVRAQLVGPRLAVIRPLPRLGESRLDREVLRGLVGQPGVLDVPGLVGGDRHTDGHVHAVDVLPVADGEHRGLGRPARSRSLRRR